MAAGRCDALMAHWRLVSPRLVRAVARGRRRALRVDRRRRRAHRPARAARRHRGHHQRPAAVRVSCRARRWRRSSPPGRRPRWSGGRPRWRPRPGAAARRPCASGSATTPRSCTGCVGCAKVKLQPDSAGAPLAMPSDAPARVGVLDVDPVAVAVAVLDAEAHREPRALRRAGHRGADADRVRLLGRVADVDRRPRRRRPCAAAAATGSEQRSEEPRRRAARSASSDEESSAESVMDPERDRSTDVTATTATLPATATRALDFDALYRDARDDVFAYAATLLRDSAAAEDVTAQAFERAYRAAHASTPAAGPRARGCSASPATRRSTSCGGASAPRPPSSPTRRGARPRRGGRAGRRARRRARARSAGSARATAR